MESQNLDEVKNITGHYLQAIANKAGVSKEYVRLILVGKRDRKSRRAKAIFTAATNLNAAIEIGMNMVQKEFQTADQD